jgi:hypothetical protein
MNDIGPTPFVFVPRQKTLRSPAFSKPFKVLALALVLGLGLWAWNLNGFQASSEHLWIWAAWLLMAYTAVHVWISTSQLTEQGLEQSWIWNKKVEMRDLAYVKLIRIPGLDTLVAPRLYARTLMGKFTVIYACDRGMLEEFQRLGKELHEFRKLI